MDVLALWSGWLLVWCAGVAILASLRAHPASSDDEGEIASLVGNGWFLGQFALTLWMRLLSAIGVPFGLGSIGAPLLIVTLLAGWLALRARRPGPGWLLTVARVLTGANLAGLQRAIWLAVLVWLAIRLGLLLFEVLIRPLYPWDAWTQWATKSRVWFALKTMVPFVGIPDWFRLSQSGAYFDAAPTYPATVPLTQVWSAILLGRFDDALINLPWWLTAVAFGMAMYGFLRFLRMSALVALLGTWIVLSLPILDVHVALAGYADLAMATYFATAMFAWLRYARRRAAVDLVLALALSAACVLIKNPGIVWVLTLIPGVVAAFLPRYRVPIAVIFVVMAAAAAVVVTQSGLRILGYQTGVNFRMPWQSLGDAYFMFANWHLLFFGAIATGVLAWRRLLEPDLAPMTITIAFGIGFLAFGFAFTNAGAWVQDQATVNRATLHLAPLIVVWMMATYRSWSTTVGTPRGPA